MIATVEKYVMAYVEMKHLLYMNQYQNRLSIWVLFFFLIDTIFWKSNVDSVSWACS